MNEKLSDPKKTIEVIQKYQFAFQKRFGQNFLIDAHVLEKIVSAAGITKDDCVLEIGPGIGTMTQYLAESAGQVIAVEIDTNLLPILADTLKDYSNVKVINQDILKVDINELVKEYNNGRPIKVVANLPYYITTPIIMGLFESNVPIDNITVMVQKEVADRILAKPGSKDYGALTIAVNFDCTAERVLDIPPSAFIPRPQVTSTVLKIRRREKPAVEVKDRKLFFSLVKMGFGQRRKVFTNAMKSGGIPADWIPEILEKADIDGKRRGETFSMEEYARLADAWYDKIHE